MQCQHAWWPGQELPEHRAGRAALLARDGHLLALEVRGEHALHSVAALQAEIQREIVEMLWDLSVNLAVRTSQMLGNLCVKMQRSIRLVGVPAPHVALLDLLLQLEPALPLDLLVKLVDILQEELVRVLLKAAREGRRCLDEAVAHPRGADRPHLLVRRRQEPLLQVHRALHERAGPQLRSAGFDLQRPHDLLEGAHGLNHGVQVARVPEIS
mmetsp:Transcript_99444/g.259272  ORF Transcript_99444/g.259272 Transcript_99444/m.259272 type:complete len:212 (+) Transcript_99444:645-1280(+)